MKLGIVTISDSVPTGKRTDLSGPKIEEIMGPFFGQVSRLVSTDEVEEIVAAVSALQSNADLIITNGGTGMTERDNTIKALKKIKGTRLKPLERAISAAMILECGPLSAIATPVVLKTECSTIIALPGKTDEVAAALEKVIKPYFIHHFIYHKLTGGSNDDNIPTE